MSAFRKIGLQLRVGSVILQAMAADIRPKTNAGRRQARWRASVVERIPAIYAFSFLPHDDRYEIETASCVAVADLRMRTTQLAARPARGAGTIRLVGPTSLC